MKTSAELQLDDDGRLRHLLTTESMSRELLTEILDTAAQFAPVAGAPVKKVPLLRGRTVLNLFFEASTRTRTTFELAATRLSADVLNIDAQTSSTSKGETLFDMQRTLEAMQVDMFVIRHGSSGAAHFFAQHAAPGVSVLNAGDGRHAHPTQALLDMYTLRCHRPDISQLSVAIVGDLMHSRVARSDIHALRALGAREIRVIAPRTLMPSGIETLGVTPYTDMDRGLDGVDVVMLLRLQRERMRGSLLASPGEFHRAFGLTERRLAQLGSEALVMHPGPINRGVELAGDIAYSPQSLILQQVEHGIAIRMAVMAMIIGRGPTA